MVYALLCCQHHKEKQPCCGPNLRLGHSGEPHLAAPCGHSAVSIQCCRRSFSPRKFTESLLTFLLLFMVKKTKHFAMWAIGTGMPRHSRNRHYCRTNSNSITQKNPKWAYSYMSKWQYQWQRVSSLVTERRSKLWILPVSISKQDALVFLEVGWHTRSRSPPDVFLKALF